jgi:hypothetical protein
VFEQQHRVGVGERSAEHAPGVVDGGRGQHLDAGDVGVPALQAVGVLGGELAAGAGGHADHQRHVELATGHVAQGGRVVEDLVQGQQAEVDRHDLHDRAQTAKGGTDARPHDGRLRQW